MEGDDEINSTRTGQGNAGHRVVLISAGASHSVALLGKTIDTKSVFS